MTRDILNHAYGALRHNRRRSALTMLGMAWGIATVVLLLAYGDGFGNAIVNIFKSYGMKVIGVMPGRTSMQAGGQKAGSRIRFVVDDIERLRENVPQITRITPEQYWTGTVSYDDRSFQFPVRGVYESAREVMNIELEEGSFFNAEHVVQKARVTVLSSEAKEKLFSGKNAIGERIRVGGLAFTVVGVAKPKMQEGNNDMNQRVFIPFSCMGDLRGIHYIDSMWLTYDVADFEGLERSIRATLAGQYNFRPDDRNAVRVFSSEKQLAQFNVVIIGLKVLLAFIGTLTLGIGGVGLMNIMLVSVTQRTREIGLLKALGAKSRHILMQFLAEALTITAAGGVLGIVLAYIISISVGTLTLYSAVAKYGEAGDIRLIVEPSSVLIATLILGAVGMISGMVPAIRASRLNPIEALRHE